MQTTRLGRTGLEVSVAGLGCGGNSRLGLGQGKTHGEAVALVRAALDLGVTLLDTAEAYGTEAVVGEAVSSVRRDSVAISTKCRVDIGGRRLSGADVVASLEASLRHLRTDAVDIFHVHAVSPAAYPYVRSEIVPALLRAKEQGKLRHLGITETSPNDPEQRMLQRAVHDDVWEVAMLAFHMLHQGARRDVFPHTRSHGIGTLIMFVVRNVFSRPGLLERTVGELIDTGRLDGKGIDRSDPLGFLVHEGGARSIVDAAYRFVRHEPGADVVLFGTGSIEHLRSNVASILSPPLPEADRARLSALFGTLAGVGLDVPDRMPPRS
jgi:aryl-alcohol dehydrogenase-like predicted oxidoreductase